MKWSSCTEIFHKDGSFRDIYVHGTAMKDWDVFLSFLASSTYTLEYTSDGELDTVPESAEIVLKDHEHAHNLTICVAGVNINCHFFTVEEIELDIDPREVPSQFHLDAILGLISGIGSALACDVVLTEEKTPDYIWLKYSVDAGEVIRVEIS